jgi:small ligand-binding sensory domain FIST
VSLSLPEAGPGPAFVHAHSAAPRWQDAAADCARTIAASGIFTSGVATSRVATSGGATSGVATSNTGANLGFVYVTDSHAADLGAIVAVLRESSGVEHWVGTVGIGVCATGIEYLDRPAIVTLAGAFPEDGFRLLPSLDEPSALPEGRFQGR